MTKELCIYIGTAVVLLLLSPVVFGLLFRYFEWVWDKMFE